MMRALRRGMPEMPVPKVDIFDRDGSLVVKAELPGVKKDDVSVEMEGHDLVIQGKREEKTETKEESFYRMERSSGSFYRRIPLPEGVKDENVTASYEDGVLEVVVPRPQETAASPRKIELK
jgi:HSP20 family protein